MIVCHCNHITADDIRCAVRSLGGACPLGKTLCADHVYEQLGKGANCCGCLALAESIIDEVTVELAMEAKATVALPISESCIARTAEDPAQEPDSAQQQSPAPLPHYTVIPLNDMISMAKARRRQSTHG